MISSSLRAISYLSLSYYNAVWMLYQSKMFSFLMVYWPIAKILQNHFVYLALKWKLNYCWIFWFRPIAKYRIDPIILKNSTMSTHISCILPLNLLRTISTNAKTGIRKKQGTIIKSKIISPPPITPKSVIIKDLKVSLFKYNMLRI